MYANVLSWARFVCASCVLSPESVRRGNLFKYMPILISWATHTVNFAKLIDSTFTLGPISPQKTQCGPQTIAGMESAVACSAPCESLVRRATRLG